MYKLIIFLSLFIASNCLTEACISCSKHTYKPHKEHIDNFSKLPNSRKLKHMALIGTHSSFSYKSPFEELKTQELDIEEQLKYGVRVLDINVRARSKSFEVYEGPISLKIYLHDVLKAVDRFLDDNPDEFIILHINPVEDIEDPKIFDNEIADKNCKLIDYHIHHVRGGWFLIKHWSLDDHIGMHRGGILLATSDKSFSSCAFHISKHCHVQNDKIVYGEKRSPNFFDKWKHINSSIEYSKHYYHHYHCFLNDISFHNAMQSREVLAKVGGYDFKSVCPRPINEVMAESFTNLHRALIIVLADFVTQELIDSINESNVL